MSDPNPNPNPDPEQEPSKGNAKPPRGRARALLSRFGMVLLYAGLCALFLLLHLRSRQRGELPSS